jgi:hypothetical protein
MSSACRVVFVALALVRERFLLPESARELVAAARTSNVLS